MGRVFTNGPGDLGLIPGHVIPKTLTMVLDTSLLNTQHSKVKSSNLEKGVAPSRTPQCCSYWKGGLLVALNYGHQLYLLSSKKFVRIFTVSSNELLLGKIWLQYPSWLAGFNFCCKRRTFFSLIQPVYFSQKRSSYLRKYAVNVIPSSVL